MTESKFLYHKASILHYVKSGSKGEVLLFFHGFGQDHSVYQPIIRALTNKYQLYIFDLYFHGQSAWGYGEKPLEKIYWNETIGEFLVENNIEDFSLVGYSMGGKFALATLEAFPEKVKRLFLIAPDGVNTSIWYSMATYPFLLRKFFRGMITNYSRFLKIVALLEKLKVVDKGLIRFADYQMGTEAKRKRVYYSWVVFRHLRFNLKKLAEVIDQNKVRVTILVGKHDKVIRPENMKPLLQHLKHYEFEILESGHSGLIYESLPYLKMEE